MSDALPYFVASEDEGDLPWSRSDIPSRRRAAPDGLVLFDRLLQLAQIDREAVSITSRRYRIDLTLDIVQLSCIRPKIMHRFEVSSVPSMTLQPSTHLRRIALYTIS